MSQIGLVRKSSVNLLFNKFCLQVLMCFFITLFLFTEHFRKLLQESKTEFHNMFTRTYGVIYQQNSYVFSDLFNELENYYTRGRVDLLQVLDTFFNTLYQKMFQVLNAQYTFDEE